MQAGDEIDVWVVDEPIGSGGMASVYRCHNKDAPRILAAVKVLEKSLQASPDANARFVREAEILFHLDHPHVVRVRNVRMGHDPPFIEMEYIDGESLDSRIRTTEVRLGQAMKWILQITEAVAYLHGQKVRHRDIKPANLLIDDQGDIKLVDFGLATETGVTQITREGIHFGTVSYAPPEWIDPEQLDPVQWDLYGIGVVFYELLARQRAFPTSGQGPPRKQALQVMVGKQTSPPLDPGPHFPDELRAVVRSLTHRDPDSRPVTADEIIPALKEVQALIASGKWHPPDEAALIEAESSLVTARPAPVREADLERSSPQNVPPPISVPKRSNYVGIVTIAAVLFVGIAAIAAKFLVFPSGSTTHRDVDVELAGVPVDLPAQMMLGGKGPDGSDGTTIHFENVPYGLADLQWVVGDACSVETCPGAECGVGCGMGVMPLQIVEGDGAQTIDLNVPVPLRKIVVNVPSLAEKGGIFKKRPELRMSLDGAVGGIADGHRGIFKAVVPGTHELIASIGTCGVDAVGCWPGECPEGCRSKRVKIELEWKQGDAILTVALPIPD